MEVSEMQPNQLRYWGKKFPTIAGSSLVVLYSCCCCCHISFVLNWTPCECRLLRHWSTVWSCWRTTTQTSESVGVKPWLVSRYVPIERWYFHLYYTSITMPVQNDCMHVYTVFICLSTFVIQGWRKHWPISVCLCDRSGGSARRCQAGTASPR